MEIADGHLENLFTNWRNIYRKTWTTYGYASGGTDYSVVGTNYFYTDMYNPNSGCSGCAAPTPVPNMSPSPAPTPPTIPLPASSNFPTEPNYTVTQYRIQAVDPMVDLDASGNALKETAWGSGTYTSLDPAAQPPPAFGPNTWQYSYFYLAAVDVSVPALGTNSGTVTAKVRRVFEKKFDMPWTYAMLYMDDLEFQPSSTFAINGPVQANGSLYIGTSNFTAQDRVGYSGNYVNGYSPNDTSSHSGSISAPTFPANEPPSQVSPFLPFGWNLSSGDNYHEIIEQPPSSGTDPISNIRMYSQADYQVLIDQNNNITITDYNGNAITNTGTTKPAYQAITGAITTNQAIQDSRENTYVRIASINLNSITNNINNGTLTVNNNANSGMVLYIKDTTTNGTVVSSKIGGNGSTVNTTERAIRLTQGASLPTSGLTIVSVNPVYIQGDYNTGGIPPSDSGTFTSPTVSGYTRKNAAVYADAINILSGAWSDGNSTLSISNRIATSTTVNAALVTGEVPSGSGYYSGGGENFVRFLEDWQKNGNTFTYYGSMIELFNSVTATGKWQGNGSTYKPPGLHWYYDTNFASSAPPGNLQIAAYLQQQRWYQVY